MSKQSTFVRIPDCIQFLTNVTIYINDNHSTAITFVCNCTKITAQERTGAGGEVSLKLCATSALIGYTVYTAMTCCLKYS